MMNLGELLFSFCGRINRAKYWLVALIVSVFLIVVFFLAWIVANHSNWAIGGALILIGAIPAVIASLAVAIKRLHDRDKSGWWLLLFYLVPPVSDGIGRSIGGPVLAVAALVSSAIGIWMFLEVGCRRGTVGPNQYGPDPLEATAV